jgi:hypothetical protein
MQEFSSISVSSYEAGILAERLTEQSSEGWSVVAIVPTGSTVTAYLSRAAGADSVSAQHVPEQVSVDEIAADEIAVAEIAVAEAAAEVADAEADVESAIEEIAPAGAGWAASAVDSPESGDVVPETSPTSPEAAADVAVEPETAAAADVVTEAAAGSAAPAGWYADPSSRFELRYWDGSQWTEHVSRSGQQYTDPPVA